MGNQSFNRRLPARSRATFPQTFALHPAVVRAARNFLRLPRLSNVPPKIFGTSHASRGDLKKFLEPLPLVGKTAKDFLQPIQQPWEAQKISGTSPGCWEGYKKFLEGHPAAVGGIKDFLRRSRLSGEVQKIFCDLPDSWERCKKFLEGFLTAKNCSFCPNLVKKPWLGGFSGFLPLISSRPVS